jgi:hypothetical protein
MGIKFFSVEKCSDNYLEKRVSEYDPNPAVYEIKSHYTYNNHVVILIHYPNCINYEGDKIIVYLNTSFDDIKSLKEIDPHFTNKNKIKPFARFEPTISGWETARKLIESI